VSDARLPRVGELAGAANEPGDRSPATRSVDPEALPALASLLVAAPDEFRRRLDAIAARLREETSSEVRNALQRAAQILPELRRKEERR
jgi:hypothetical protein